MNAKRGMVEHANAFGGGQDAPGIHLSGRSFASKRFRNLADIFPRWSANYRLKASFVIPSNWTIEEKAILLGLKKYGCHCRRPISGGFFLHLCLAGQSLPANVSIHLATVSIDNFEVIQTTGPTEGPRSPNPPAVRCRAPTRSSGD
jgi:hypothetical protein